MTDPSYVAQVLCFSYPLIGTYGVDERAAGVGAACSARASSMRDVRARSSRPGCGAAAWSRSTGVDTRTLVRRIRDGGVAPLRARRGDRTRRCTRGRSPSRRSTAGRSTARSARAEPYVGRRRSARRRRRPRLRSGRSRAGSPTPGSRPTSSRAGGTRTRSSQAEPRAVLIANGPGDPAVLDRPGRDDPRHCSAACRCSASASATSCSGSRSGTRPSSSRSATAARTIPVQDLAHRPRARHRPEPRLRGRARTATVSHVSLNDGTCEGLRGDGFASVQFHPEASPGPLDALPFFDRLADACRSAPTFARS